MEGVSKTSLYVHRRGDAAGPRMARLVAWTLQSTRARCSPRSTLTAPTTPSERAAFTAGAGIGSAELECISSFWYSCHIQAATAGMRVARDDAWDASVVCADKAGGHIRWSRSYWAACQLRELQPLWVDQSYQQFSGLCTHCAQGWVPTLPYMVRHRQCAVRVVDTLQKSVSEIEQRQHIVQAEGARVVQLHHNAATSLLWL